MNSIRSGYFCSAFASKNISEQLRFHANSLPDCLLGGVYKIHTKPELFARVSVFCDPSGTELEPIDI